MIHTNKIPRLLLDWNQLTDKEKKEFDWIEPGNEWDYSFFRYKNNAYCLSDFMIIGEGADDRLKYWDGYSSDSFFSGILIKLCEDTDYIICGWYSF